MDRRFRGARGCRAGRAKGTRLWRHPSIHPLSDDRAVDYQYRRRWVSRRVVTFMFRILIVLRRAVLGMTAGVLRAIQIGGIMLAFGGFLLFGSQCIEWLKTGVWAPHTLEGDIWLGWPWPRVTWVGVQRIIDWLLLDVLSWPTALVAIIIGGAVAGGAAIGANRLEDMQKRLIPPRPI